MSVTCNWSVNNMTHKDIDGGVIIVNWSCVASSAGDPVYSATEAGKLQCEYDVNAPGFIPYDDLTEANVLGWVYNSLIEEDETAEEAKARVEANRIGKVVAQEERANSRSDGLPWNPAESSR
jgi:hypothetical protein